MLAGLIGIVLILGLTVGLFFVFRSVVLWYFKIDEAVQLLRNIDERLRLIPGTNSPADS